MRLPAFLGVVLAAALTSALAAQEVDYGFEESFIVWTPGPVLRQVFGDLNGDGRADVFTGVFSFRGGPDYVSIQQPDGSFKSQPSKVLNKPFSSSGTTMALLADMDGDRDLDIVREIVAWLQPGHPLLSLQILWNRGDGYFTAATSFTGAKGWLESSVLRAADVDGDGDLDLVRASYEATSGFPPVAENPIVLRNDGRGNLTKELLPGIGKTPLRVTDAFITDLDGDRRADLFFSVAVPAKSGAQLRNRPLILLNAGSRGWVDGTARSKIPANTHGFSAVLQDLDADGDCDYALATQGTVPVRLFENLGRGIFRERSGGLFPGRGLSHVRLLPFDLEGDGKAELLMQYDRPGAARQTDVYEPAAGFALVAVPRPSWQPGEKLPQRVFARFAFVDFDGDGDRDFLGMIPWAGGQVWFLRRSLERLLVVDAPRVGRAWRLLAGRRPGAKRGPGLAGLALAGGVLGKPLRIAALGLWQLAPAAQVWLGVRAIPDPAGVVLWSLPVPGSASLIGRPLAAQGLVIESTGAHFTRAWAGKIGS